MATSKKAVQFNESATIETLLLVDKQATESKYTEMAKLVLEFGDQAIGTTAMGGLSRNSFKDGVSLETQQRAAISLGLALETAQSLARIIGALNSVRPTMWQDFQIAYFGLEAVKPSKASTAEKTQEQIRFAELQETKNKLLATKKDLAEKAKMAGATALILGAQGKTEEAKKAMEVEKDAKAKSKEASELAKAIGGQMESLKAAHKDAALYDATLCLVDKLKARFGVECFDMTLEGILKALSGK